MDNTASLAVAKGFSVLVIHSATYQPAFKAMTPSAAFSSLNNSKPGHGDPGKEPDYERFSQIVTHASLLLRINSKDEFEMLAARDEFFHRYYRAARALLLSKTRDEEQTNDCLGELWVRLCEGRIHPAPKGEKPFRYLLAATVANIGNDSWRQGTVEQSELTEDCIEDLPLLARKLASSFDPVSTYLRTRLSPSTRLAMAEYDGPGSDPNRLLSSLASDLRAIIKEPLLFEVERFAGVQLSKFSKDQLSPECKRKDLPRLNWQLLVDAYPGAITRRRTRKRIEFRGTDRIPEEEDVLEHDTNEAGTFTTGYEEESKNQTRARVVANALQSVEQKHGKNDADRLRALIKLESDETTSGIKGQRRWKLINEMTNDSLGYEAFRKWLSRIRADFAWYLLNEICREFPSRAPDINILEAEVVALGFRHACEGVWPRWKEAFLRKNAAQVQVPRSQPLAAPSNPSQTN